ncbi:BTAD domain-containing putative transcriptional regulator [Plantactinospora sp. GCM10030261]|uniref:BTAD domain-containing putative transcriptional regulator n=1 Tax=Plantactinospora sp. GCM10030261 TaxID=3273420 RepID=UPI00360D3267
MRFGVLGPLAAWTDAGEAVTVPGLKVRALLADLIVHAGRPVSTDRLVDDLWGDGVPANPAGAVQVRVSQLRKALADAEPGARDLVVSRPPGYLLQVDAGAVDAGRFAALTARARTVADPRDRAALFADALALWRGPAYADFADEEFVRAAANRLEEQRLAVLEEHAETRLELGEHSALAAELSDLVERHPLRERLRAAQLLALYRAGRPTEALDSFRDLRERLADELGLDPGPGLVALHRSMLAQDPALTATGTPPANRPPTNLPAPVTALIGRDEAIDEVRALLAKGRLVTLVGSGGVGKTRLAIETARQLHDEYDNGVFLVELAGLDRAAPPPPGPTPPGPTTPGPTPPRPTTPEATAPGATAPGPMTPGPGPGYAPAEAVLAVLGIRDAADGQPGSPTETLVAALRGRRKLLVLDNCEHLVEEVADLVDRIMRGAEGISVLATSREPLGLAGEVLWDVPPLTVPEPGADAAAWARSSAVQLFVTRAAATAKGFALDAETGPAVALLCRRLDGIPLALELAATRVRALGVHGLVARLDDRFRLLATGHRGAPHRQRTLTAMVDWSWDLLSEPERVVLRRLAVHVDGCTLESAEAVCAGDDVETYAVLDLLARLVDRSLVVMAEGGEPRYRLLESVTAYCLDRLAESGETDRIRMRHAGHYTELAARSRAGLTGHGQREWLRRMDAESANLRAAFDHVVRRGAAEPALRLATGLVWYRQLRGRLVEAARALDTALALADENAVGRGTVTGAGGGGAMAGDVGGVPAALRADALAWRAGLAAMQGEVTDWLVRRDEALAAYATAGDPHGLARAQWFLAHVGTDLSDVDGGTALLTAALATFRDLGDRWGEAAVLSVRAKLAHAAGDTGSLTRDAARSAELFDQLGDRWGVLQATEWLGSLAEMAGDHDRALRLHREGLEIAEELGLWPDAVGRLGWLGWTCVQLGDYPAARAWCERALAMSEEHGFRFGRILLELVLGIAARRDGLLDLAETHLGGLERGASADDPPLYLSLVLTELGFAAELRGDAAEAVRRHTAAFTTAGQLGGPRDVAYALVGMAGALSVAGEHRSAARVLGSAEAARRSGGLPAGPAETADTDRIVGAVRAALGDADYAIELERGGALTPEEALRLATVRAAHWSSAASGHCAEHACPAEGERRTDSADRLS